MPDIFQLERIGNSRSNIVWKKEQEEKLVELYKEGSSIRKIRELFD